jgi:hypothetical protein
MRPVLVEDGAAERIDLALVRDAEACTLEAKITPSNAGEKRGSRRLQGTNVGVGWSIARGSVSSRPESAVSQVHLMIRFQQRTPHSAAWCGLPS